MSNREYFLINVLFVALLFCLFLTASILDEHDNMLSCQVVELTGKECTSCGLTRDFISFAHLDFTNSINGNSKYVFLWFLFQLIARSVMAFLPFSISSKLKRPDVIITVISAVLVFLPFWL